MSGSQRPASIALALLLAACGGSAERPGAQSTPGLRPAPALRISQAGRLGIGAYVTRARTVDVEIAPDGRTFRVGGGRDQLLPGAVGHHHALAIRFVTVTR